MKRVYKDGKSYEISESLYEALKANEVQLNEGSRANPINPNQGELFQQGEMQSNPNPKSTKKQTKNDDTNRSIDKALGHMRPTPIQTTDETNYENFKKVLASTYNDIRLNDKGNAVFQKEKERLGDAVKNKRIKPERANKVLNNKINQLFRNPNFVTKYFQDEGDKEAFEKKYLKKVYELFLNVLEKKGYKVDDKTLIDFENRAIRTCAVVTLEQFLQSVNALDSEIRIQGTEKENLEGNIFYDALQEIAKNFGCKLNFELKGKLGDAIREHNINVSLLESSFKNSDIYSNFYITIKNLNEFNSSKPLEDKGDSNLIIKHLKDIIDNTLSIPSGFYRISDTLEGNWFLNKTNIQFSRIASSKYSSMPKDMIAQISQKQKDQDSSRDQINVFKEEEKNELLKYATHLLENENGMDIISNKIKSLFRRSIGGLYDESEGEVGYSTLTNNIDNLIDNFFVNVIKTEMEADYISGENLGQFDASNVANANDNSFEEMPAAANESILFTNRWDRILLENDQQIKNFGKSKEQDLKEIGEILRDIVKVFKKEVCRMVDDNFKSHKPPKKEIDIPSDGWIKYIGLQTPELYREVTSMIYSNTVLQSSLKTNNYRASATNMIQNTFFMVSTKKNAIPFMGIFCYVIGDVSAQYADKMRSVASNDNGSSKKDRFSIKV